jgi:hypothetical protein
MKKLYTNNWTRDQLLALLAILLPFIIIAIAFLFRNAIEHDMEINENKHDIISIKKNVEKNSKIERENRKELFDYFDHKIEKIRMRTIKDGK